MTGTEIAFVVVTVCVAVFVVVDHRADVLKIVAYYLKIKINL